MRMTKEDAQMQELPNPHPHPNPDPDPNPNRNPNRNPNPNPNQVQELQRAAERTAARLGKPVSFKQKRVANPNPNPR